MWSHTYSEQDAEISKVLITLFIKASPHFGFYDYQCLRPFLYMSLLPSCGSNGQFLKKGWEDDKGKQKEKNQIVGKQGRGENR